MLRLAQSDVRQVVTLHTRHCLVVGLAQVSDRLLVLVHQIPLRGHHVLAFFGKVKLHLLYLGLEVSDASLQLIHYELFVTGGLPPQLIQHRFILGLLIFELPPRLLVKFGLHRFEIFGRFGTEVLKLLPHCGELPAKLCDDGVARLLSFIKVFLEGTDLFFQRFDLCFKLLNSLISLDNRRISGLQLGLQFIDTCGSRRQLLPQFRNLSE